MTDVVPAPAARQRRASALSLHREWAQESDAALLLAIRAGDRAAYSEIYRRYEPVARRYARSLVPASAVDDVVAESFARVLGAISRSHGPSDHPVRYLMVTVRTTAADVHNRQRTLDRLRRQLVPRGDEESPEDRLADEHLTEAFRALSARWRMAIWWSEIDGMGPSEIGERLDIGANAAAALTYRARRALREAYLERASA